MINHVNKIELPTIKNTKVATHPHAVFTSRPLSSLIRTASALQNCLPFTDYITRENLFDIMNDSIIPELESDTLKSENGLNNKNQSFYNLYENMKNENKYATKESLLDIMNEKSKSNHNIHNIEQFDKPNQHPKMNLNSLLNDQESNDHDFYFCQSDNLNFENIYHNDNVSLTKDVQYSAMDLMPVQYSTMDLMSFQYTAMDFQCSTTDLVLFQNEQHLYFNNYSNLNSENFLKNDQVQVFDYNHVDYSMKHKNEDDQYKYQY
ncbi:hypothetical protein F8M41_002195 [Gigaspora margarita]|uniref:Uncharacterized protein n=1 Tax=Gigaspora margarita TaxID=4874 RepID=A0A8H3XD79_GIGMA|nr:hypothetical protein F8M41_002195 [Gigaspora margarita]